MGQLHMFSQIAWASSCFYISFLTSLTYGLWSFLFKKPVTKNTSLRCSWLHVLIAFWGLLGILPVSALGKTLRAWLLYKIHFEREGIMSVSFLLTIKCVAISPQEAQGMEGRDRGALKARKVIAWSDSFFILCLCLMSLLSVIVSDSEPWRL